MNTQKPKSELWLAERLVYDSHRRHPAHRSHLCLLLRLHLRLSLGHLLPKSGLSRNNISDSVIHLISELVYKEGRAYKECYVEEVSHFRCNDTLG